MKNSNEAQNNRGTTVKLLISIVALVAFAVADLYLLNFVHKGVDEIVELREQIQTETARSVDFADAQDKLADLMRADEFLSQVFVDSGNVVGFIEKIETAAGDNGLSIQIQDVDLDGADGDGANGDGATFLTMLFQTSGDWNSTLNFLEAAYSMPHQIFVDSLRLKSSIADGEKIWNANFSLRAVAD